MANKRDPLLEERGLKMCALLKDLTNQLDANANVMAFPASRDELRRAVLETHEMLELAVKGCETLAKKASEWPEP